MISLPLMVVAITFQLTSLPAAAASTGSSLVVVADYGGYPLSGIFDGQGTDSPQPEPGHRDLNDGQFPVLSTKIKSQRVRQFKYSQQQLKFVTNTVFLVGEDDLSIRWLALNSRKLKQLGAKGLFVSGSKEGYLSMRDIYADLSPVPGDSFSNLTSFYPVLITAQGMWQ